MKLLKIGEVKDRLNCTRQHVYNLIKRKDLSAVKDGGFVRIKESELFKYIERHS